MISIKNNASAKTRSQIAEEYQVSRTTFYRLLKRHHIDVPSGLLYPKDQQKIYGVLGKPGVVSDYPLSVFETF